MGIDWIEMLLSIWDIRIHQFNFQPAKYSRSVMSQANRFHRSSSVIPRSQDAALQKVLNLKSSLPENHRIDTITEINVSLNSMVDTYNRAILKAKGRTYKQTFSRYSTINFLFSHQTLFLATRSSHRLIRTYFHTEPPST